MRYKASISFEHDTLPVRTHRCEVEGLDGRPGARRAVEQAMQAFPGARWRSLVVVLEKLGESEETS